jgi:predicted alpha/beta superfamily hydrolase
VIEKSAVTAGIQPVIVLDSQTHVVHSSVVDDDYQLSVWLPPSYASSTAPYPVVYVLDAPIAFALAAQATMMSIFGDVLPEVIVVGVGPPLRSAYEYGPTRTRDYAPVPIAEDAESGHGDEFAACLRTELLPFIDDTYRTEVANRTLSGHSLGDVFALHMMLEQPGLFHRFIAASPSVVEAGQAMLDPGRWPSPNSVLVARLLVSVGSADDDYRPHVESFITALQERNYRDLQLDSAVLPGYGHIDAAPAGFLGGLREVFGPGCQAR